MPLDLAKIVAGDVEVPVFPRDIFTSLPRKPWPRLRLEQGEVLKAWFDRRFEQDLVIKQNTGSGKTVVGLLVAQSSLNERCGPAAYLVPDTYLVEQVLNEARRLGLNVTDEAKSTEFRSSQAILVSTFHKVMNGRTVFGVRGTGRELMTIGTVVIDDAHAALAASRSQFTASIPAHHEAYKRVMQLFEEDLRQQSAKNLADLMDGQACAPMRIPFWTWQRRQSNVLDILNECGEDDQIPSMYFAWPLIAEHLSLAVATISHSSLEIRTPCPSISMIPAFHRAHRRIYLTATLADDGVLVTDLGASPQGVRKPITPERAADLGDRIILAPLELNPRLGEDAVREMVREFADGSWGEDYDSDCEPLNVVVLVPSDRAAEAWRRYADKVLHVKDMKPVIQRMTRGQHVGLVVLVNKYDGVDLPNTACRLLVIDGIPTPLDAAERRESTALAGSQTYQARKIQRIEQGMGRGVRDAEDYCAVLLLGSELGLALVDQRAKDLFSPATRAQVDLSRKVAAQISGEGLDSVRKALTLFLMRSEDWCSLSSKAITGVQYDREGSLSDIAIARREAFDKAAANNPAEAVSTLRAAVTNLRDPIERGWYLEEAASYQQLISPDEAQAMIRHARDLNQSTLRPKLDASIKPVKGSAAQAQTASTFLMDLYDDALTLRLAVRAILERIEWGEQHTSEAEKAVQDLGKHLGFVSTRPEHETGIGPDNLWALSETHHAVIELKTGVSRRGSEIIKSETGQLSDSMNWDFENNPHVTNRTPVLVHPYVDRHQSAHPPKGTRIITPDCLDQLKQHVLDFADQIASDGGWKNSQVVAHALASHKLTGDKIIAAHSSMPKRTARGR